PCTTTGPGSTCVLSPTPGASWPSGTGEHGTAAPAALVTTVGPPMIVTLGQPLARSALIIASGAQPTALRRTGAPRRAASGAAARASGKSSPVATSASAGWLPPSVATAAAV